ncbi:hypothetical protein [Butyrivibrio sp. INlla21]|uniref:hypothetical protein n=1 Tax=Butyrivibrio sp. INlla21 TaxID=1520811 RepID=UPI0008DF94BC|nr:hypothetical protein [Butyrivibrio sp. INlla21]SFU57576.1 hypothetical protein SAMN02910342_00953 [Butyrivibrio sp. INlla21]
MDKYHSLNVLNLKNRQDYMSDDCIQDVANMINASGQNRSQRRRLEKSLGKVENIMEHTQKHLDRSAYAEYQKAVDQNFIHFFAVLGLTMIEDYGWKETPDNDHGQITSLFQRVDKKIKKYSDMGYTTEDLVNLLDEQTGIVLVADKHN